MRFVPMLFAAALATACADDPSIPDTIDATAPDGAAADVAADVAAPARCELAPTALVSLPADDTRHASAAEWLYWTGHLAAADGRRFGLHVTVLFAGRPGQGFAIAHHSLTAPDDARPYRHAVEIGLDDRSPPAGFELEVGGVAAHGHDGVDHLESRLDGSELVLDLVDQRGPIARHGTGFKDYGGGVSTYYYARPRMRASGTLTLGGERLDVTGDVWFDHQWGALASPSASRWDWLGVQLDDGRELMVTLMPDAARGLVGYAELTARDCTTTIHEGAAVALEALGAWTSPATACTYPSGWALTVGDEVFELTPVTPDQEVRADPIGYWEGASLVAGAATGRAYVELVGYCAVAR